MSVVQLKAATPGYHDIVMALRDIADHLESGEQEWPVTTMVVVMGHTDAESVNADGDIGHRTYFRTYGLGPRSDPFTLKGLLADVIHKGFGDN